MSVWCSLILPILSLAEQVIQTNELRLTEIDPESQDSGSNLLLTLEFTTILAPTSNVLLLAHDEQIKMSYSA